MNQVPLKRRKHKSMGKERPQLRSPAHLKWVRGHECAIADKHECYGDMEAAHARTGTDGSMGVKPSDIWAVPLCFRAHSYQHNIGEPRFEKEFGIDMKAIAKQLAKDSPAIIKLRMLEWRA